MTDLTPSLSEVYSEHQAAGSINTSGMENIPAAACAVSLYLPEPTYQPQNDPRSVVCCIYDPVHLLKQQPTDCLQDRKEKHTELQHL